MTAIDMTAATAPKTTDPLSRVVRAKEIPWQPMRFPGCAVKPLMVELKSELATPLLSFKMEPGAELSDCKQVLIEQTTCWRARWSTRQARCRP